MPHSLRGRHVQRLLLQAELIVDDSDLPVIVSLETHASPEQQEIMVEIMEDAWEGLLVPAPSEENAALPTPAELKGKILVKVKAAPVQKPETIPEPELAKVQEDTSSSSEDESKNIDVKQEKKSKIIEELSSLGIYTRSYHFKTLNEPEATVPTHIFSLSEKKLMDVHQNQGPQLFSHNRDFMMRTYPSGTRVSSSNLDPTFFWRKGVQIVALNWQRFDAVSLFVRYFVSTPPDTDGYGVWRASCLMKLSSPEPADGS